MQHGFYNNYQALNVVKSFVINFNNHPVQAYCDKDGTEWFDIWSLCYALGYAKFVSHPSGEYRSPQFYNMLAKRCGDKPVEVFRVAYNTHLCVNTQTLSGLYARSKRNYKQRKLLKEFLDNVNYRKQTAAIVKGKIDDKIAARYDNIRLQIEQLKNEYQAKVIALLRKEFNV